MTAKKPKSAWGGARYSATPAPRGYPPDLAARQDRIARAVEHWGAKLPLTQRDALKSALERTLTALDDLDKPIIT